MSVQALIDEARADLLGDTVEPYLWSDARLTQLVNEAVIEACNRTPLIRKTKTVSVVAGTAAYTLDIYTRMIFTAALALDTVPLTQATPASMDITYGYSWRTATGTPKHYIREGRTLTLYPIPIVNDTLTYMCSAVPDSTFVLDDDIRPEDQHGFIYWMAYKALLLPDKANINALRPFDYLAMFNSVYGNPKTVRYREFVQNSPLYGTVFGGRMC